MNSTTGGGLLIAVGLLIVVVGFFGFKTQDKVVDLGPIHATKTTQHDIPYAPIAGGLVIVGGVALMIAGKK